MLPLMVPGLVAGCVFVFVPSLGNFPVPQLLGGGRGSWSATSINQQFLDARDWPFGSTLALGSWSAPRLARGAIAAAPAQPGDRDRWLNARRAMGAWWLRGHMVAALHVPLPAARRARRPVVQRRPAIRHLAGGVSRPAGTGRSSTTRRSCARSAPPSRRGRRDGDLRRVRHAPRAWASSGYTRSSVLDSAVFVPVLMPDIVTGIALLSFYSLIQLPLGSRGLDRDRALGLRHRVRRRPSCAPGFAASTGRSRKRHSTSA